MNSNEQRTCQASNQLDHLNEWLDTYLASRCDAPIADDGAAKAELRERLQRAQACLGLLQSAWSSDRGSPHPSPLPGYRERGMKRGVTEPARRNSS